MPLRILLLTRADGTLEPPNSLAGFHDNSLFKLRLLSRTPGVVRVQFLVLGRTQHDLRMSQTRFQVPFSSLS